MRAAQIALVDAVLFRLGDAVPGIEDQQIVDTPVLQRERRQFDDIDELARLDEHMLIRLDIDRAQTFGRIAHGNGNTLTNAAVAVKPSRICCRSHPRLVAVPIPGCCPNSSQDVARRAASHWPILRFFCVKSRIQENLESLAGITFIRRNSSHPALPDF